MTDPVQPPSVRDHLANERTLLAWVRTAITVIGLGFLVDRLSVQGTMRGWDAFAGIALVLFGAALAVAGAYSYLNARRELAGGAFRSTVALHLAVVGFVAVGGLVVAVLLLIT